MSETVVNYALEDGVALLRLNDPTTLNAFSESMGDALDQALVRAEASRHAQGLRPLGIVT